MLRCLWVLGLALSSSVWGTELVLDFGRLETDQTPPGFTNTLAGSGRLGRWPLWKSVASLIVPADADGARRELARLDLAERLYERCDRLSGGQLQRVALARVLYQQPDLLLADEPVAAMDPALSELTVALLNEEAARRGVTLVASLHAVDLALRHFPRVVGVKDGAILFDLPAARVSDTLLRELYASEIDEPATETPPPVERSPLRCA